MGDLGKLIVAKGFKKLPKVQKIARSGHTAGMGPYFKQFNQLFHSGIVYSVAISSSYLGNCCWGKCGLGTCARATAETRQLCKLRHPI